MRPLTVILDSDPETTVMWNSWSIRKATIKGSLLTVKYGHGDLFVEAADPQLVCDLIFSHEQKNVIAKGKLGITSVRYTEKKDDEPAIQQLRSALKGILECGND
jgi:hypothetical protein